VPNLGAVPASRRATSIAVGAVALAVGVAAVLVVLLGPLGSSPASGRPCSSYPTPGAPAPAAAPLPARLTAEYSLLAEPQRPADRLTPQQVAGLKASGLIMSGTRFLGDAAFGGRIYIVPAEHLLSMSLAPARCLSSVQRLIEQESLSVLRSEYNQAAVCIDVLYANGRTQECAPATSTQYALASVTGTPAFGLVPNGVSAVTVTYPKAPPTTVAVHRNSFVIVAPSQAAPACGLQWLDPTGNVQKVVTGCSYLTPQIHELSEYRAYVAGKLSALRAQVSALSAALGSGNLTAAKSAWLTAHLTWLDIGQDDGAYGCFGALGSDIDGLAAGHPLGTADPGFTGFHRIEFDLWTNHDARAAAADTAVLQRLLAQLMKVPLSSYLPATATGIGNWLLRPHEVLEDALRDSLTANDDYGSGTDLASLTADVTATREMLNELQPGLHLFAPHLLGNARAELDALLQATDATRVNGTWTSIQDLPPRQRQQLDADAGAALETLAPIPDLLTSNGTNTPGD
jgi:iron uptake system EfeUOB component EfeO/EfeM